MNDRNQFLEQVRGKFLDQEPFAPDPRACPPAEELWDAANEQLDRERLIELTEHAAGCPSCAQLWAAALETEFSNPPSKVIQLPIQEKPITSTADRFRQWRIAASLTMMLFGIAMLFPALTEKPEQTVSPERGETVKATGERTGDAQEQADVDGGSWLTAVGLVLLLGGGAILIPTLLARSD